MVLGLSILLSAGLTQAKPLKVFILCGQSNMEGHAELRTFPSVAKDPKTASLYQQMVDQNGKPVVCDHVWIAYTYGDFSGAPAGNKSGKLTTRYGSQHHVGSGKIGPEFTFGITMDKNLKEPVLLIKTAWGGKSLMVDFRPPSAGELQDEKAKANSGKFYGLMMNYVKEVLADPKKVVPDYDPAQGYELAGFVWFQGFNDLVGAYPSVDPKLGKKSIKDYSEYSRLLACLIRDVRKDLSAPKMPFVVGVLGVGGETVGDSTEAFRKSMAAPAEMEEFKGNVFNVYTHKYWPSDLCAVMDKVGVIKGEYKAKSMKLKGQQNKGVDVRKEQAALDVEMNEKIKQTLTPDEFFLMENGVSNAGYHYLGSAKFFAQIGKAFADTLLENQAGR